MNIILKTDVVLYAMFHIEHIMCSIHTLVCGSALLLSSLSREMVIFLFCQKKSHLSLSSYWHNNNNDIPEPPIKVLLCFYIQTSSAFPFPPERFLAAVLYDYHGGKHIAIEPHPHDNNNNNNNVLQLNHPHNNNNNYK